MAKPNHIDCLGYSVFDSTIDNLPSDKKILVNTLNQYSYCIAERDAEFKKALIGSDILLPDGISIVWSARLLYGKKIKKIAGADIHDLILERLNRESGSCFYLGSSEKTLSKIKERINKEYPNIRIDSYSPPFKPVFSCYENTQMIEIVNLFKPDVLFIGMTAPKQEKWGFEHKDVLDTKIICSIGAVFDFYARTVERPKTIWIELGLEWLGRLLKEPKRMWKRYIYYGFIFLGYFLKEKWKLAFKKSN